MRYLKSWHTAAILFLALAPWLVFWQAALGQLVFAGGDVSSFFYPVRFELARALAESRLPLWAPGMGAGFPLYAEGQAGALYPPNLLLYRLLPIHLALNDSILFHLSWASVGMFLFARASGMRVSSATLAGFAFVFSGFFLAHLQHLSLIATAAWLGWMLFFQNRMYSARREGGHRWILFFALASLAIGMQFLSGFPQIALFNLIAFVAVGALDAAVNRDSAWESAWLLGGCVILGLAIGAVQLLPTAELATLSARGAAGEKFFASYSLELGDLPQFISPYVTLGEPFSENQEFWGFVGISVLVLALSALTMRRNARTWFLLAFVLIALALALGGNNPIYGLLYAVPVFNRFRVPARFLFLFTFAVVNLAAIAFDELQNRLPDSPVSARFAKGFALFVGALVAGIAWLRFSEGFEFWMDAWAILPWLFLAGALGLFVLAGRRAMNRAIFATAALGLVIVELSAFAVPFLFTLDALVPATELTATPPVFQAMDATQAPFRVWTNNYAPGLRPNRPMAYGKQSAQIYSPLALERNDEYLNALSPPMLNLIGIRYVMQSDRVPATVTVPPASLPTDWYNERFESAPTRITRAEIISFTSGTAGLGDGTLMGEVTLLSPNGKPLDLSLRIGNETAEWNYDSISRGAVKHTRPTNALPFVARLFGGEHLNGQKFVARYEFPSAAPPLVNGVAARSNVRSGTLTIERVTLFDETGKAFSAASLAGRNDYSLEYIDPNVELYENRDALPRAFAVHRAQVVNDERVLARMSEPDFQPGRIAFLSEGDALDRLKEFDAARIADEVSIVEYRPERVVIRAKTAEAGYLILADSWYPGWVASVDGQPTPIERADFIFRAVKLSAGEHQVVFEYRPASFAWGAGVSILSAVVAIGLGVMSKTLRGGETL